MGVWSGIFKSIGAYVTGEAILEAFDGVQDRIENTTRRVIKTATLWVIFIVALMFMLWGFGLFLTDYFQWYNGLGLVVVGAIIMVLALLVKAFR